MNIPCKRFENVFYPIKISIEERKKKKKKDKCCTAYYIHFTWKWVRSNWNKFKEVKKMAGGYIIN